ncbi:MAG: OmpA family protein [Actinomycetota bacterium]|nr:OmpA family protein [Actinomycetota bacterium]
MLRRTRSAGLPRSAIVVLVVVVGLLISAFAFLAGPERAPRKTLVWVAEKTTAAPSVVPKELTAAVYGVAGTGDGELVVYPVGRRAERLEPVSLTVKSNGDVVRDERRRRAAIDDRLAKLRAAVDGAPVGKEGFSLYAVLQAIADEAAQTDDRIDVWLSTTILTGSVDPLRVPALTADPTAAVTEIMKGPISRLKLGNVNLHPVLLVPVGPDQAPLTAADEAWRTDFVTQLGKALGAEVTAPVRSDTGEPPWASPAVVPPVIPLVDATPEVPLDACAGNRCVIDNLAFHPNEARLVDRDGTRQRVAAFVAALAPRGAYRIRVTGFTAAFGDAKSARVLSQRRAGVIAALLEAEGVPPEDHVVEGLGFDRRADPTKGAQDPAQRVVILTLEPRG